MVEDNPVNQKLAMRLLEKQGHEVTIAGTGFEAVERAAAGGFDVILMDVQMPGMDGLQATMAIREAGSRHGNPRSHSSDDGSCHERRPRSLPRRGHGRVSFEANLPSNVIRDSGFDSPPKDYCRRGASRTVICDGTTRSMIIPGGRSTSAAFTGIVSVPAAFPARLKRATRRVRLTESISQEPPRT